MSPVLGKALPRVLRPLLLGFLALLASQAQAQQALLAEAQELAEAGRNEAALVRVERFLAERPTDARGRFLRGVLLVESGRDEAAIDIFRGLVADHPELPEPYNNLAVLYAARGEYEQARDALVGAINTHPSYAIAHENLGDIYARLASIAYDRALLLDGDNSTARSKLALVHELFSDGAPAAAPRDVITVAAAEVTPAQQVPALDPAAAVRDAVMTWARAWSRQDVAAYLDAYGSAFQPPGGASRVAWEAERYERLRAPAFIELDIDDLEVEVRGVDRARVVFMQAYRSDTYRDRVRKVLELARTPGGWKIVSEVSD